jgi:hypothetical protein
MALTTATVRRTSREDIKGAIKDIINPLVPIHTAEDTPHLTLTSDSTTLRSTPTRLAALAQLDPTAEVIDAVGLSEMP